MEQLLDHLLGRLPDVERQLLENHLARLPERYFERFAPDQIMRHVEALSEVTAETPVVVQTAPHGDRGLDVTVLADDASWVFSMITGVLSSLGAQIESGDIFTYRSAPLGAAARRYSARALERELKRRRKRIIDHFRLSLDAGVDRNGWCENLRQRLEAVFALLAKGDADSLTAAKHRVNGMVAARLEELAAVAATPVLYPMTIAVDNADPLYTCLKVSSEDTPFFLYAFGTALSLRGNSIEQVRIQTRDNRIEDEIDIVDGQGRRIDDPKVLDQIRLSVLLTKQFTYFLPKAPEPYAALCRFEKLVDDLLSLPEQGKWLDLLARPRIMGELAKLLGTSDFMWEDFIRLQYESLLPMLQPHVDDRTAFHSRHDLAERLTAKLAQGRRYEEKRDLLNAFKDREIFLIDLDHILTPGVDFLGLSARLTDLAELVVGAAGRLAYERLQRRFGTPRTVAGLEATYAIVGLGKLGGVALGYASDIELLFVYSDGGRTDGEEAIDNSEFFNRFAEETCRFITAKRDGIFDIDLRLRPYGADGPLAVSLAVFCKYFGPRGPAHAYERLALVRMRAVAGDGELGRRLERLRDEMIYFSRSVDLEQLRELRQRQFEEKRRPGRLNAKFSPGALVDLEYDVQVLQVLYGREHESLRTPRVHEALKGLAGAQVITDEEARRLAEAYDFLRQLINGLRMLRGTAKDLYLPDPDADEYDHLARRMGYRREGRDSLSPARQLYVDFDTCTAAVRAFVERHFGRESLPGSDVGNVADLVLSAEVPAELRDQVLTHAGFQNPGRAYTNLRKLAGDDFRRGVFARLAVLACDMLRRKPAPDMALNNWERFVSVLPNARDHYEQFLRQPTRLEVLLGIFAGSQFLADTLVRSPHFLDWVTNPENIHRRPTLTELREELDGISDQAIDERDWLDRLRRFRRREILRIGTRDICLGVAAPAVTEELSALAEAVLQAALRDVWRRLREEGKVPPELERPEESLCVLALGKLGGGELNYSSDIDLVGLCADDTVSEAMETVCARAMERLRGALSSHTPEGYVYRVDLRLRPYGGAGVLVQAASGLAEYYEKAAALWEVQALLKCRAVAGNLSVGERFLERMRGLVCQRWERQAVVGSIEKMRNAVLARQTRFHQTTTDVKSGLGGIRDAEFLVQGLQLVHAQDKPEVLSGNTLEAIGRLAEAGVVDREAADRLAEDYVFLRRVEHYLQLFEDRQIHALPTRREELLALAKRIDGPDATVDGFVTGLKACQSRVRAAYEQGLLGAPH